MSASDSNIAKDDAECSARLLGVVDRIEKVGDSADNHQLQIQLAVADQAETPGLWLKMHSGDQNKVSQSNHSICLVEVAPTDFEDQDSSSWKLPLSEFTSRKASVVHKDTKTLTRRTRKYYKAQDELIKEYETLEERDLLSEDGEEHEEKDLIRIALRLSQVSFAVNFVLLVAKAVAVALSGSISVISSLVDSSVDLLSGIVIWYTSRAVRQTNPYIYPSGKRRMEPLAIVVLSVIMSLASFQLIIESIQKIITYTSDKSDIPVFEVPTITITSCTVAAKLGLFILCYTVGKKYKLLSGSVGVLMQDHRNDVLSNTVSLICGYLGSREFTDETGEMNVVYIDPIGAIIIGTYILICWWQTGLEQIKMLTGITAKPDFLSKITWICLNHDPHITKIDTVRAFHFGSRFLVEVDIVLPHDMTLALTHGIGESLQQKLERLKDVERAFVHVDWETEHRPEMEHRVD